MSEQRVGAGLTAPGEYTPAGEAQGLGATFTADQVAGAFNVAIDRVHRAIAGEFNLGQDGASTPGRPSTSPRSSSATRSWPSGKRR